MNPSTPFSLPSIVAYNPLGNGDYPTTEVSSFGDSPERGGVSIRSARGAFENSPDGSIITVPQNYLHLINSPFKLGQNDLLKIVAGVL